MARSSLNSPSSYNITIDNGNSMTTSTTAETIITPSSTASPVSEANSTSANGLHQAVEAGTANGLENCSSSLQEQPQDGNNNEANDSNNNVSGASIVATTLVTASMPTACLTASNSVLSPETTTINASSAHLSQLLRPPALPPRPPNLVLPHAGAVPRGLPYTIMPQLGSGPTGKRKKTEKVQKKREKSFVRREKYSLDGFFLAKVLCL